MTDFCNIVLEFFNSNAKKKYNEQIDSLLLEKALQEKQAAQQFH